MILNKFKFKFEILLWCLLFTGYLFLIWSNFKTGLSQVSYSFGYADFQHHWRLLDDFIRFKMPFRDYVLAPGHGWFYLLIQSIPYLLFGQTFLAVLIIRHLYLPIIAVTLSFIVAKNILGKRYLILIFLFFMLLWGTNYEFTATRHLIAELSLSFFILYIFKNRSKYLLISGVIAGLSNLISFEYWFALNITILFIFFASFFSKIELRFFFFNKFLLGEMAILAPYFSWLFIKGVLRNYWEFTYGFINNFYYASPASGDSFPRLSEIQILSPVSKLMVFNIPIEFLQRLNFYVVFIFYFILLFVLFAFFIKKREFSPTNLVIISLVVYGLLIFVRTLDTPCVGYFSYCLIPFFLLLTFLIEKIILRKKIIGALGIVALFSWFILTQNTGYLVKVFGKEEKITKIDYEEEFYTPIGWFIRKDFAREYKEITDYIVKNTTKDEFLYVYPWGPYNQLANRPPPNSLPTTIHFLAGEHLIEKTKKELVSKKPKLVVINLYNNLGIVTYGKTRGDVGRYFSLGDEDGPVFVGYGNEVEKYILKNYEVVLKNNLAIVLTQRIRPITIIEGEKREIFLWDNKEKGSIELQFMKKTNSPGRYAILGKNATCTLVFEKPVGVSDISIEFKLDGNLFTKHLTRYFLKFYVIPVASENILQTRELAWKDWQIANIPLSKEMEIKGIKIEIDTNTGLIWWHHPNTLEIKRVTVFK